MFTPVDICVVGGAGYVGLITGLGLAEIGHRVINVDIDQSRVNRLQNGESPIHEEGIDSLLRRTLDSGRLHFSANFHESVKSSRVVFIAVGTPSQPNGEIDLSQVIQVAEDLVQCMDEYKLIVIKSTVPVSTVELVLSILRREKSEGEHFDVVANPEFLREGNGLYDFFYPDRIVIGGSSKAAISSLQTIYEPISTGKVAWPEGKLTDKLAKQVPMVVTDIASAQIIKYTSNAFLATRISFINEIAGLCERVGADIKEVAHGVGFDPRIGHSYLEAGPGFGGPCLEKDLNAVIKISEDNGYEPSLLKAVLERNDRQIASLISKLKQLVGSLLYKKTIAILGLSFKSGTNDIRNSLALKVIDQLEKEGAIIQATDPLAIPEFKTLKPHIKCFEDTYDATYQADALLILTEWPCFKDLEYSRVMALMNSPYIVDGRNLLDPEPLRELGFEYIGIGRHS